MLISSRIQLISNSVTSQVYCTQPIAQGHACVIASEMMCHAIITGAVVRMKAQVPSPHCCLRAISAQRLVYNDAHCWVSSSNSSSLGWLLGRIQLQQHCRDWSLVYHRLQVTAYPSRSSAQFADSTP